MEAKNDPLGLGGLSCKGTILLDIQYYLHHGNNYIFREGIEQTSTLKILQYIQVILIVYIYIHSMEGTIVEFVYFCT